MNLEDKIRVIEDFPKEGISFKDITTLLKDKKAFKYAIDSFAEILKDKNIDLVIGPEARGFMFGAPLAYALDAGFIPARKKGKLPSEVLGIEYGLEYGKDIIEIHKDAITNGARVVIIDDLLATGGTIEAVTKLVEELGGEVVSINFLIELTGLNGREKLKKYDVDSLIKYEF
ncbi:adenine phosphoribosyltransferase [Clostridium pasteurianum DSM 525 = ATCC 6013]|uniref:Adenine phosphoribosyltransferase n=1 Tax=Clostridium pasteurianum DSM 525 = ATCC 6013 TaxID=1262449 RepID=A0A0H3J2Y9_CLOPA|nr:adenine phosphoribosyltransferase [Clostridium pasteurianum]AJA48291.1 adenine phosphoribosyltransferase [Clostridium pasteurianum DSM 525 = ATCC 6013]AJA52279.1 adenine phosphoribosyltransferase [Clostridium pasteurianum DSM 525 = ATCC 6013]AOZ75543.1 adenine phosphoribosyltransferase [Clostridium pasteurianum DSM 525 = ATCC 6013]AOZ79338.1 adenine phosphoribosyltransferase [Clostridium pasteurianum]ELP60559.1 adenine phosphoribosyltransferase [Clostridium pasteurianum DSM 525 = ATCC 6013]